MRRTPYKYNESIDRFLDENLEKENEKSRLLGNHKQHLTNAQIYDMVKEAGFDIGLTVVSDHIKQKRNRKKEVFIRQEYDYGDRCEYDFGEVNLSLEALPEHIIWLSLVLPHRITDGHICIRIKRRKYFLILMSATSNYAEAYQRKWSMTT